MKLSTILGGAALATLLLSPALMAAPGQYSGVSTKGNLSVWRVNHQDGSVSLCSFEGHINEPVCYPWSAGAEGDDDAGFNWRVTPSVLPAAVMTDERRAKTHRTIGPI